MDRIWSLGKKASLVGAIMLATPLILPILIPCIFVLFIGGAVAAIPVASAAMGFLAAKKVCAMYEKQGSCQDQDSYKNNTEPDDTAVQDAPCTAEAPEGAFVRSDCEIIPVSQETETTNGVPFKMGPDYCDLVDCKDAISGPHLQHQAAAASGPFVDDITDDISPEVAPDITDDISPEVAPDITDDISPEVAPDVRAKIETPEVVVHPAGIEPERTITEDVHKEDIHHFPAKDIRVVDSNSKNRKGDCFGAVAESTKAEPGKNDGISRKNGQQDGLKQEENGNPKGSKLVDKTSTDKQGSISVGGNQAQFQKPPEEVQKRADVEHDDEPRSSMEEYASVVEEFPDENVSSSENEASRRFEQRNSEILLLQEIILVQKVIGYKDDLRESPANEVERLYDFLGMEVPLGYNNTNDPCKLFESLDFLKAIVGVK